MKKNLVIVALCALLVVLFASCTTFTFANAGYGTFKGTELGTFDITVKSMELLGVPGSMNLASISQGKGQEAVAAAIQAEIDALGGTAAINVTVEQNTSLIDILLNSITGSILAGEEVHVTGTVIK